MTNKALAAVIRLCLHITFLSDFVKNNDFELKLF